MKNCVNWTFHDCSCVDVHDDGDVFSSVEEAVHNLNLRSQVHFDLLLWRCRNTSSLRSRCEALSKLILHRDHGHTDIQGDTGILVVCILLLYLHDLLVLLFS